MSPPTPHGKGLAILDNIAEDPRFAEVRLQADIAATLLSIIQAAETPDEMTFAEMLEGIFTQEELDANILPALAIMQVMAAHQQADEAEEAATSEETIQ